MRSHLYYAAQRQAGSIASAGEDTEGTASATAHMRRQKEQRTVPQNQSKKKRALGEITSGGGGIVAVAAHIIRSPAPTR